MNYYNDIYNAKSGTAAERADPKQTSFSRGFKGMSKNAPA